MKIRRLSNAIRLLPLWTGAPLCLLQPGAAHAEGFDLLSAETLSANGDFRLVASEGERSWTDGGYGKARFGGTESGDWKVRPIPAEANLIWQPRFSWTVGATIVVAAQHDQDHPIDLVEGYISIKPLPRGSTHVSARAGLYWPQISLEHEGAGWVVSDMITSSAINSWIGEEVKVIGAEATISQDIGSQQLSATIGIFGFNDTSGTLLAFRGWALHDLKTTAFGREPLPPLNGFMEYAQAAHTRPTIEIDDRPGFYGRVAWRLAAPVTLSAFYYRNRGVPEAVTPHLQWGWDTRFWNLGARIDLSSNTKILAQALIGTTEMGYEENEVYWVETRFRAAYLRVSHRIGSVTLSGRTDVFGTRERGSEMARQESESGWAITGDADWKLSDHVNILGELLHIHSKRGTRAAVGLSTQQDQTIAQLSVRLHL